MNAWLNQHLTALRDALRRLAAALNSTLSIFVIGIALALPAAGWLAIDNVQRAANNAAGSSRSASSWPGTPTTRRWTKSNRVSSWRPPAAGVRLPRRGAQAPQEGAGVGELIASLPRNPLPDAFIVEPADTAPAAMERLAQTFAGWPGVAHVQLRRRLDRRFDALLRIARLVVGLLAAVFAAALIVVTFSTIRLQILGHAAEIEVARLIGATDAWIRRPFTYFGALQGALGGLLAAASVGRRQPAAGAAGSRTGPAVQRRILLHGPSPTLAALLALAGATLGWVGVQLPVSLSLRRSGC